MLLQKIKDDLKRAMKAKDGDTKDTLRMILGEIPRLNKRAGRPATDKDLVSIINKLIKSETVVMKLTGEKESDYINTLKSYLPQKMDKTAIKKFILDNIEIDGYDPKVSAMKVIMKVIGSEADGKLVKEVLMGL